MAQTPPNDSSDERLALVRELVVEAGLEVLDNGGLGLEAGSISYSRVLDHLQQEYDVRISRGSVHGRIWANSEDFRNEVLAIAAQHSSPYEDSPRMHRTITGILTFVDGFGLDRKDRVRAFCRIAGRSLLLNYLASERFRRFQSIKAAARSRDDDGAVAILRTAVRDNADGNQDERVRTFGFMFRALGLRARRDLNLDDKQAIDFFMTVIQVLVTGSHLDHCAGFTKMAATVETDLPADENHPWTYFGFAFLAAIEMFFEPDPDFSMGEMDYELELELLAPHPPPPNPPDLVALIGDRPRRTSQELREQLLAAGVELLLRDGLGLKAEALTYSAVFAHIKETRNITVHRSTVHQRIWSSQEEFRADILAEAARYHTGESLQIAKQAMAAQTVVRNPDGTPNVRQLILDSTLAIVSAQMVVSASSTSFRRWQSIKASLLSNSEADHFDRLRQTVSDRYDELIVAFAETYQTALPLVGLRVNPDLLMSEDQAYHLFSVIGATITSGSDYNISAGATLPNRTMPIPRADGSGRSDDWPIQALATIAMLDLFFVPVVGTD